ncbi:MAG: hypothetical protein GTO63_33530 [Anaerolineae bacterium]|nr:hypothetical protein [Anaerolineae bacterium]NIN99562.1 hypothetical protein [Anaerolineae bacterium]
MAALPVQFGRSERIAFLVLGVFGLVGPNGVFLYYTFFRWPELLSTLRDPVALAFLSEAFLVMGILAYYFAKISPSRRWMVFIALSLIGGLAFSVPVVLLTAGRPSTDNRSSIRR